MAKKIKVFSKDLSPKSNDKLRSLFLLNPFAPEDPPIAGIPVIKRVTRNGGASDEAYVAANNQPPAELGGADTGSYSLAQTSVPDTLRQFLNNNISSQKEYFIFNFTVPDNAKEAANKNYGNSPPYEISSKITSEEKRLAYNVQLKNKSISQEAQLNNFYLYLPTYSDGFDNKFNKPAASGLTTRQYLTNKRVGDFLNNRGGDHFIDEFNPDTRNALINKNKTVFITSELFNVINKYNTECKEYFPTYNEIKIPLGGIISQAPPLLDKIFAKIPSWTDPNNPNANPNRATTTTANILFYNSLNTNLSTLSKEVYFQDPTGNKFTNLKTITTFNNAFLDPFPDNFLIPGDNRTRASGDSMPDRKQFLANKINFISALDMRIITNELANQTPFQETLSTHTLLANDSILFFAGDIRTAGFFEGTTRTYVIEDNIFNDKPNDFATIYIKISKYLFNDRQPIQEIYIAYNNKVDEREISYIDTQILPERQYRYEVRTGIVAIGGRYTYNFRDRFIGAERYYLYDINANTTPIYIEAPMFEGFAEPLKIAPLLPDLDFDVDQTDRTRTKIHFRTALGKKKPEAIFESDIDFLNQNTLQDGTVSFADDTFENFELYVLEKEPVRYTDFSAAKRIIIQKQIPFHTETFSPDKTYYITAISRKNAGGVSSPSSVFKIELKRTAGSIVQIITPYVIDTTKIISDKILEKEKTIKKVIKISPSFYQKIVDEVKGVEGTYRFSDISINTTGNGLNSIWQDETDVLNNKLKFKMRITSKTSGRKVDINFNFQKFINRKNQ